MARDKAKGKGRYSVPIGTSRLAYFGCWEYPEGRFKNFAHMHAAAGEQLVEFVSKRECIMSDERLTDVGRREQLGIEVEAFENVARTFKGNAVADRKPKVIEALKSLRGVSPRAEGDLVGQMADWEMRQWYKGLKGDRAIQTNGALRRGELPEVAAALCRMPDAVSGLREDLREVIAEHAVAPENADRVAELREELQAIEMAEAAFETARNEIYGLAQSTEQVTRALADAALAELGLQKKGEFEVGPLKVEHNAEANQKGDVKDGGEADQKSGEKDAA